MALALLVGLIGCIKPVPRLPLKTVSPSLVAPPATQPEPTATPLPTATLTPTAEPTSTSTPEPIFKMCSPLALHPLDELSQIIGDPYHPPPPGREERHHGVDFGYYHWQERDSMLGEPVQSVLPGVVASVLDDHYPYGNMVMIEISQEDLPPELVNSLGMVAVESLYVLYAHLNLTPLVQLGQTVEACQPLGEVGMSGNTDIPHLHLETRLGPAGTVFESMRFYDTRASQEEMDAYKLWRTSGVYRHFDPMVLFSAK